jgi:hypothetical protein
MHGRPKNDVEIGQKWPPMNALGSNFYPLQNKHLNFFSPRQLITFQANSGTGLTAKVLGRVSLVALPSDPARSALRPKSA